MKPRIPCQRSGVLFCTRQSKCPRPSDWSPQRSRDHTKSDQKQSARTWHQREHLQKKCLNRLLLFFGGESSILCLSINTVEMMMNYMMARVPKALCSSWRFTKWRSQDTQSQDEVSSVLSAWPNTSCSNASGVCVCGGNLMKPSCWSLYAIYLTALVAAIHSC